MHTPTVRLAADDEAGLRDGSPPLGRLSGDRVSSSLMACFRTTDDQEERPRDDEPGEGQDEKGRVNEVDVESAHSDAVLLTDLLWPAEELGELP